MMFAMGIDSPASPPSSIARRISRSVTIPVTPGAVRTNTLLTRFSISSRTVWRTVVSGAANRAGELMTSRTRCR